MELAKEKIVKKTHKGEEVVGDNDDLGALVDVRILLNYLTLSTPR